MNSERNASDTASLSKFRSKRSLRHMVMACGVALLCAPAAWAEPVTQSITVTQTDWTSAGVGGIGGIGTGDITISGVTGTVTGAYLYWHGIEVGGVYNNPTVTFNANSVTGDLIGSASTNCWGAGESRAYRADVTPFVSGDGTYSLAGLATGASYDANGASLIVTFDDGNPANNRDIVIFDGNDSSEADAGFPSDPAGWDATLANINFTGGTAGLQFHVGDGQTFDDGDVTVSTVNGAVNILDDATLYDGLSTADAGDGRSGPLWDIHDFDVTAAFGGVTGSADLNLTGMSPSSDCLALIAVVVDLVAGSAPPPPGPPSPTFAVPVDNRWALLMLILLMAGVVGWHRSLR